MTWLTNEKRDIKADIDHFVLVPHAPCAGLCAFCCNALTHSNQRSPDSRKIRCGVSFNSSIDLAIDGSVIAAVVITLP